MSPTATANATRHNNKNNKVHHNKTTILECKWLILLLNQNENNYQLFPKKK